MFLFKVMFTFIMVIYLLFARFSFSADINFTYSGKDKEYVAEAEAECPYFGCNPREYSVYKRLDYRKRYSSSSEDERDHYYLKLDSRPKEVELIDSKTGDKLTATFRLTGILLNTNHNPVPGDATNPIGGCSLEYQSNITLRYVFFWRFPEGIATCFKQLPEEHEFYQSYVSKNFFYTVNIESPDKVRSGVYLGDIQYNYGTDGDIDFGEINAGLKPLIFTISAEIEHDFQFWFPPGSNQVVLEPRGGWLRWLHSGIPPDYIGSDVNFYLETSGPLAVTLVCDPEYISSYPGCALKGTETFPLDISITIPGMSHQNSAVERLLLSRDNPVVLTPESSMGRRNSVVHFSIHDPERFGDGYRNRQVRSKVTLVFDAMIP